MRNIIFTLEGGFADARDCLRLSFLTAFKEFGLDWSLDPQVFACVAANEAPADVILARTADGRPTPVPSSRLLDVQANAYLAMLDRGHARLRPGVARLADECQAQGIPVWLASSHSRLACEVLVNCHFGIEGLGRFRFLGTAESDGAPGAAALPAPGESVLITDSPLYAAQMENRGGAVLFTPTALGGAVPRGTCFGVFSDLGTAKTPLVALSGDAPGCGFVTLDYLRDALPQIRAA